MERDRGPSISRGLSSRFNRTASIARLRRTYSTTLEKADKAFNEGKKNATATRALLWFVLVLMLGGAIFSALERSTEIQQRQQLAAFLRKMHAALSPDDFHELVHLLTKLEDRVAEEMANLTIAQDSSESNLPDVLAPQDWDFTGACFFCFTAATTIGYGNYTPKTDGGKLFLVFYAFIAIPACLNAFAEISDRALELLAQRFRKRMVFQKRIEEAFKMFDADRSGKLDRAEVRNAMRILGYKVDDSTDMGIALSEQFDRGFTACDPDGDNALDLDEFRSFVLTVAPDAAVKVELVLSKGYVVILASAIFLAIVLVSTVSFSLFYEREQWSALDAFYFTIVSFTTIGFGDFSPDPHPGWFAAVFIAFTFFGLGITATLVRAASDPAFDMAATTRGLAPRTYEAYMAGRSFVQMKAVDLLGLPVSWRPGHTPIVSTRPTQSSSQQGFAAAVAAAASKHELDGDTSLDVSQMSSPVSRADGSEPATAVEVDHAGHGAVHEKASPKERV